MTFIGDDDMLVTEKNSGRVRRITGGVLQPGNVLDLAVNNRSERGLLSIVRDPDFFNNGYLYLFVTESPSGQDTGSDDNANLRVYRYFWNGKRAWSTERTVPRA